MQDACADPVNVVYHQHVHLMPRSSTFDLITTQNHNPWYKARYEWHHFATSPPPTTHSISQWQPNSCFIKQLGY